ncbi:MAG: penicillin-binding protein 2, partial [Synergistota bacterium]|nr:penicillin-binding protein 2 [Synergistota bacterium]
MRERLPWLLIGLFFVLICWRIVDVQLLPDPRVVAQAGQQYWAQVAISTGRGAIEDRNGFPLALSSPSISLFIDPLYWNPSRAKELSPLLTPEEIREISRPLEGRFRWLARKLEPERADKIMHLSLPGVFAIKEMKRTYSGGELAAHVIGFVDIDDRGLAGIEYEWDRVLYSPPQAKILLRNAAGNLLDVLPSHLMSHGRGSVQLTIDARIQYIVSKHLARGAERHKAQWGTVICMDPRDGAVLAMASWPTFDP